MIERGLSIQRRRLTGVADAIRLAAKAARLMARGILEEGCSSILP